jgi:hypothetical protein
MGAARGYLRPNLGCYTEAAIKDDAAACDDIEAAERVVATALAVASTQLDAAEDDLDRLLEKVYGTLIVDMGKASAEAFFPKLRGASRRRSGPAGDAGGDAAAPA